MKWYILVHFNLIGTFVKALIYIDMAEISISELSVILGSNENAVRAQIKRGKIIKSGRARVDDEHPTNKAYIKKRNLEYYENGKRIAPPEKKPEPKTKPSPPGRAMEQVYNSIPIVEQSKSAAIAPVPFNDPGYQDYLGSLPKSALEEELMRRKIIITAQEEEYKRNQALLSEVKRKKMEGELIPIEWVIFAVGQGIGIFKDVTNQTFENLLETIFAEQGISASDRERYIRKMRESIKAIAAKYKKELTVTVSEYTPLKAS